MTYDLGLAQRVREALDNRIGISERKMFGGLAFLVDGKMFVGVQDSTLMARVGPERHQDALAVPHVREMDFTGRPMKGYVYVDAPGLVEDQDLQAWVQWCASFVGALPAKKVKSGKIPSRS
jgi:TfoX/Sxy family transcriptional regulator of competence genes